MMPLKPVQGGFGRPLQAGLFIRDFLMGRGPEASIVIDPVRGSTQSDINYEYKEASARATAREHAEKIISNLVVSGLEVTEEEAENIYQRQLKRISRKFTHMRYHSFLVYFGTLKKLGWVEATRETESSSIQDNYPSAPGRVYYRLTPAGKEAGDALWSNPLFALHPEYGLNHRKKPS
jgi:DNA-binding PadR family transcriptional regulator